MKLFFKSFYISSITALCLGLGILGMAKAYEGIRLIGFGEHRDAIAVGNGVIYFFDAKLTLPEF